MEQQSGRKKEEVAGHSVKQSGWYLYVLSCSDHTLYTGITTNLARRVDQHNRGCGAIYTAARRPVTLVAAWLFGSRREASCAEIKMKGLSRQKKKDYINDQGADFEGGVRIA